MGRINDLAAKHFDWVERMGWHNKTVLESLALIASELGEVADEIPDGKPTESFGEEIADIFLRVADLATEQGIDLEKMLLETKAVSLEDDKDIIINMLSVWARWTNTARKQTIEHDFAVHMGLFLKQAFFLAEKHGIDLFGEIEAKIAKNETRGTRGRRI